MQKTAVAYPGMCDRVCARSFFFDSGRRFPRL